MRKKNETNNCGPESTVMNPPPGDTIGKILYLSSFFFISSFLIASIYVLDVSHSTMDLLPMNKAEPEPQRAEHLSLVKI